MSMDYSSELLHDFVIEARELITNVDHALVELERDPANIDLLNKVYRWFHTIKGGASFVNASPLVDICHTTENVFDKLRNQQLHLTPAVLDIVLQATAVVHSMLEQLANGEHLGDVPEDLIHHLQALVQSDLESPLALQPQNTGSLQLEQYYMALQSSVEGTAILSRSNSSSSANVSREPSPSNPSPPKQRHGTSTLPSGTETTMRVDTARLDYVLNLSGEIGLVRNRLNSIRTELLSNRITAETLKALDEAVGLLDVLVTDLQNAVMKTRMQPIGRLFQKFPRIVRDTARQLNKEVELVIEGAETELDKTMIEELNDPLIHLLRNAIDHGIESPEERRAHRKPIKGTIVLKAEQTGDQVHITLRDDGRGIDPEALRKSAVKKGLLSYDAANALDDRQALHLIFMPGFSTKEQVSDISGRGVGMDVVRTNIAKLNGKIDIESSVGQGTTFHITLPLTLAILPVLIIKSNGYPIALPLTVVREILPLSDGILYEVGGKVTVSVRDELLPLLPIALLLGWECIQPPRYGIVVHVGEQKLVLGIEAFVGRDDVVIKPIEGLKVNGIAGATLSGEGEVILIADIEGLLHARPRSIKMSHFRSTVLPTT
ncbi:MAG: chemotaxis protein CheA [Bacteroidota bacterium]|nr:chemotaxis protein CheA [Candidatus Kapabacteria bacterium]MCX7936703.1 chemotaxis protein CheA [Chlorobiota bacterium]MDW8075433.1 chemotaxis protein CheA [Bacteroidota bacterium]MDW8272217.1 chemotaxis protein CheA [Bacteroidota bacterium]